MDGRLDEHVIASEALRGNPLGDPHERPLWVYLPPGYDDEPDRRYPTIYLIQGMTGQVDMWRNRSAVPADDARERRRALRGEGRGAAGDRRLRRLLDLARRQPVPRLARRPAATTPTSATRSCRSSTRATGRWPRRAHRGITGKSSGGYGAMVTPMLRPDLFGGLATHAGDALFEACYQPEFAECGPGAARRLRRLVRALLGGLPLAAGVHASRATTSLINDVRAWPPATRPTRTARSTARSTRDRGSIPEVWERWLRWDPVRMARRHADGAARRCGRSTSTPAPRRVLPRPRRRGVPPRARGDRRHRRLLRAVRGRPRRHRVPLPARDPLPRRTAHAVCD